MENTLKRSQVEVVRVGRSGHDAVLCMHTFKHNKSQKQVSIQVKGSVKRCPVCSIVESTSVWEAGVQGSRGRFGTPGRGEHRVLNTQLQNLQSNRRSGKGSIRCPAKGSGVMEELSLLKLHQAYGLTVRLKWGPLRGSRDPRRS